MFVVLADEHGLVALAWGLAANAAIALGVPLAALGGTLGAAAVRRGSCGRLVLGSPKRRAVPLALQGLYVIALRFASGSASGRSTRLSYAYFVAAVLVAVTATSLSLISTVPLTRRGVDGGGGREHVVTASWLCLPPIAAAAGVFALAGERIVRGGARRRVRRRRRGGARASSSSCSRRGWSRRSASRSRSRSSSCSSEPRARAALALGALVVDVPLSLGLRELWGLEGLALALGLTTLGVLAALLLALSTARVARGRSPRSSASPSPSAGSRSSSFGAFALVASDALAAAGGLALYVVLLALVRPRGLREAWGYMRELH